MLGYDSAEAVLKLIRSGSIFRTGSTCPSMQEFRRTGKWMARRSDEAQDDGAITVL
jgi:hypothetical protein